MGRTVRIEKTLRNKSDAKRNQNAYKKKMNGINQRNRRIIRKVVDEQSEEYEE